VIVDDSDLISKFEFFMTFILLVSKSDTDLLADAIESG
jgi:hypothetical protein